MKKTITPLTLCLMMLLSLQSFAQNDSTRTSPSIKLVADSSYNANDTISIGNMIIVKKQGYQDNRIENNSWYNKKRNITHGNIALGNMVVVKRPAYQNQYNNRRNRNMPIGTIINITNGKIKKDTFLSVNDDTVRLGRLNIIKSQDSNNKKDWESMIEDGDFDNTNITIERAPKKLKNVTTNWFSFDLGYANYIDESPQMAYLAMFPPSKYWVNSSNLKLDNRKASNFNIWIVQQKLNIYQHKINLKYGVGFEMFNFRFEQPVSFRNEPNKTIFMDDVNFTKNKLFVKYLTVPVQLNFQPNPYSRKGFYASIGLSAGYLVDARNKQISPERGKQKYDGNFELNNLRFATIGELGIGGIRLYGSYGSINLFDKNQSSFSLFPYALGLRFSNF
jgi:hypothetical protein